MEVNIDVSCFLIINSCIIYLAPFVYQCSELISSDGKIESDVCDYCLNILKAQSLIWGPTHTEIKYTSKGPRLIEINARWHAQHFQPIVDRCLGYNAVTTTLEAFFQPGSCLSKLMLVMF